MGKIYEVVLDSKEATRLDRYRFLFRFFYHRGKNVWYATQRALSLAKDKGIEVKQINEIESDGAGVKIIESFPASLTASPPASTRDEIVACSLAGEQDGKIPSPIYLGRDLDQRHFPGSFILDMAGGKRRYLWRYPLLGEDLKDISLENRFPKLLSRIKDPDTKFVLSFGGGGFKAYAHNVICRLVDELGVRPYIDEVWGTSSGSIGALWYASGVSPEEMDQSGYDLYSEKYSLSLSPSKLRVIKNLLFQRLLPNGARNFQFSGFMDAAKSIYDYILNVKKYRQPNIPFYCIAFNLSELRSEVLTPVRHDIPEYKGMIYTVDPIEAAIASSSVPVLFVPKVLRRENKDVTYIDGSATESVPMISIYNKWLLDRKLGIEKRSKLFILSAKVASNAVYRQQMRSKISEVLILLLYHDAMQNAIAESHRAAISADPNVEILQASVPLSEWYNFDFFRIPTFIKSSYVHYINDLLAFEKQG